MEVKSSFSLPAFLDSSTLQLFFDLYHSIPPSFSPLVSPGFVFLDFRIFLEDSLGSSGAPGCAEVSKCCWEFWSIYRVEFAIKALFCWNSNLLSPHTAWNLLFAHPLEGVTPVIPKPNPKTTPGVGSKPENTPRNGISPFTLPNQAVSHWDERAKNTTELKVGLFLLEK